MDDLKAKLAVQEAELKQKNENADKLIQVVGVETEKVSKEKAIADEEEIKVEVINKVGLVCLPEGQVPPSSRNQAETFVRGQTAQPREPQERRPYPTSGCILRGFLENAHSQPRSSQRAPPPHCSSSIAAQPGSPNTSPDSLSPVLCCCFVCCSGFGGGELETEPRTSHTLTKKC